MYLHRLTSVICLSVISLTSISLAAPKDQPKEWKDLKFRSIGPAAGGRVCQAVGVSGDPLTYYAATASGGLWKSTDGGIHFTPIFDDQAVSSIGCVAVAPSDANVVYVGAGEPNVRGNVAAGNGIYRSTDAGKSWQHVWKAAGQVGAIIVHPTNPDIAFAAVLGRAFGPNPERGIYRTLDGGKTWVKVLYKNAETGGIDLTFAPDNPRVIYAALWQVRRRPWELTSGGPHSDLQISRDGGETWTSVKDSGKDKKSPGKPGFLPNGLPAGDWGRIGLAVAPAAPNRVYALVEAEKGGLFRSDDGGDQWELVSDARYLRQRAWYFSRLAVDPVSPDVLYAAQVPLLKSIDGGRTWKRLKTHHVDHHSVWIDPKNPKRIIVANDGGVDVTCNGGETWYAPPLPISQFYHISCDNRTPYHVSGNMQDLGTAAGPSHSLHEGGILLSDWYSVGGGETGFTAPDPVDPNIVYAGEYGGFLSRYDHRIRTARPVMARMDNPSGITPADMKYRFQWTAPLRISPHDPKTIYHAANVIFRTSDGGQSWQPISGDLTRNDKQKQQWSGGPITGDNTGAEIYCTVFAVAESPKQKGLIWAGSDDGLVHISRDAGKSWKNVTANIPGLPDWGTVACIEPSHSEPGTAWLVVDAHRLDNPKPYLWKTTDFGETWKSLSAGLDEEIYLHVVREDPKKPGMLFVGTEQGIVFSPDGGESFTNLKLNLPPVAVHDLQIKGDDLVVGTHGRSIWILDDLTFIREWSAVKGKSLHVFAPLPAVKWHIGSVMSDHVTKAAGENPASGAVLHYFLKSKSKSPLELEILDAQGKLVTKLDSKKGPPEQPDDSPDGPDIRPAKTVLPNEPGLHRVVWDLTRPGADYIPKAKVDSGDPTDGVLVPPGVYTLKLTANGQTVTTTVQVLLDPRLVSDRGDAQAVKKLEAGINEQQKLARQVQDGITKLATTVKDIQSLRQQIARRSKLLKEDASAKELLAGDAKLAKKLASLEEKLHNPEAKVNYDIFAKPGGAKLYSQMTWLLEMVKVGDAAPTQPMRERADELAAEFAKHLSEFESLRIEVGKLNELARKGDWPILYLPKRK